jgi:hypothetical protein
MSTLITSSHGFTARKKYSTQVSITEKLQANCTMNALLFIMLFVGKLTVSRPIKPEVKKIVSLFDKPHQGRTNSMKIISSTVLLYLKKFLSLIIPTSGTSSRSRISVVVISGRT